MIENDERMTMRTWMLMAALLFAAGAFGANAWMQNARKSPKWFTEGVMYQIQPRSFTPEGTLRAATRWRIVWTA